jgi:hypothetical protein
MLMQQQLGFDLDVPIRATVAVLGDVSLSSRTR